MTDLLEIQCDPDSSSADVQPASAPDIPALDKICRDRILTAIDASLPKISALARQIWEKPELGYQEFATATAMTGVLRAAGFEVTESVAGLPTAFVARWRQKTGGPVIGFIAEMDALAGFSQDDSPTPSPVPGLNKGHACGHHLFGAGSIGAALAVRQWLQTMPHAAELRVYGTPAEEGGAGKVFMARAGLFDDLDLVLHWHPDDRNAVWQSRSLASAGARFLFTGQSAHAALAPEAGRSALHGLESFHHMLGLLRQTVPAGTQIHNVTTLGGVAPNIIPDRAESMVALRHPDPAVIEQVLQRVDAAAQGAAFGTGTSVSVTRLGAVHSILPNATVGRVMYANMRQLPRITWDASEYAYARQIQQSLPTQPPLERIGQLMPYRFGTLGAFSSDMGDVSWLAPCGALGTVTWVPGTGPHTWQAVAAGGSSIAIKGLRLAMQGLASTAAHFISAPDLLAQARADLLAARGADYRYKPLIAPDQMPDFARSDRAGQG